MDILWNYTLHLDSFFPIEHEPPKSMKSWIYNLNMTIIFE